MANLIQRGFFNTILTTNFDDLVNEACLFYTPSLKPLVCSHHSAINQFRWNTTRPKVIKLHGDFLFESIRNTEREISNFDKNTEDKLAWLAEDTGLMVVGYAGNDDSVMSCIHTHLRNGKYPHGVYWCTRDIGRLSNRVQQLTGNERFYLVKCDGFDGLMAQAHESLIGVSPPIIGEPFAAISQRLSRLVVDLAVANASGGHPHPAISRDFEILSKKIKPDAQNQVQVELPTGFVGALAAQRGEYAKAIPLLVEGFRSDLVVGYVVLLFECLRRHWDQAAFDQAVNVLEQGATVRQSALPRFLFSLTLSMIHAKRYDEALRICDIGDKALPLYETNPSQASHYNTLNRLQIIQHRGDQLSDTQKETVRDILNKTTDHTVAFGCRILLGEHSSAVDNLKRNLSKFPPSCPDWPIVKLLPLAEANRLRGIIGTGTSHIGELYFNFKLNLDQAGPSPSGKAVLETNAVRRPPEPTPDQSTSIDTLEEGSPIPNDNAG